MPWIRVDVGLEIDRRFRKLDGYGRALIQFLWRLAKKNEGKIKAEDWDSDYFSDMTGFRTRVKEIEKAMDHLLKLKFVEPFESGPDYFINNWEKYQKPKDRTNAQRQARHRSKAKPEKVTERNAIVTPLPTVTPLRNASNGVHDSTGQDIQDKSYEQIDTSSNKTSRILETMKVELDGKIDNWTMEQSVLEIKRIQGQKNFPDSLAIEAIKEVSPKHINSDSQDIHSHIINLINKKHEATRLAKPSAGKKKPALFSPLYNLESDIAGNWKAIDVPRAVDIINTAMEDGITIPAAVQNWIQKQDFELTNTGKINL